MIQSGVKWRIGKGNSVPIWRDKWLLSPSSGLPLSPPKLLEAEACVSSLIQHSSGTCNAALIDQIFLPNEAELIKSIPLSIRDRDDAVVWSREQNGKFTVRSAYKMLKEAECSSQQSCSDMGTWKKILEYDMVSSGAPQGSPFFMACMHECVAHHGEPVP